MCATVNYLKFHPKSTSSQANKSHKLGKIIYHHLLFVRIRKAKFYYWVLGSIQYYKRWRPHVESVFPQVKGDSGNGRLEGHAAQGRRKMIAHTQVINNEKLSSTTNNSPLPHAEEAVVFIHHFQRYVERPR